MGAEKIVEDDGEGFEVKMERLRETLEAQFDESERLSGTIRSALRSMFQLG